MDKSVFDKEYIWNPSNASVNVINHVMLASIWIIKFVSVGKKWSINWWNNVLKLLKKKK